MGGGGQSRPQSGVGRGLGVGLGLVGRGVAVPNGGVGGGVAVAVTIVDSSATGAIAREELKTAATKTITAAASIANVVARLIASLYHFVFAVRSPKGANPDAKRNVRTALDVTRADRKRSMML